MKTRRLVMLRHGQSEFNADTRMQGQLDTQLSELGRLQALAAAEVLGKRQPLLIVSSDLRRAYDTAVALGGARVCASRSTAGCAKPTLVTGRA